MIWAYLVITGCASQMQHEDRVEEVLGLIEIWNGRVEICGYVGAWHPGSLTSIQAEFDSNDGPLGLNLLGAPVVDSCLS